MSTVRTLCFVLMPFGSKPDSTGALIDFDSVYRDLIGPAIASAGLEPIRAASRPPAAPLAQRVAPK